MHGKPNKSEGLNFRRVGRAATPIAEPGSGLEAWPPDTADTRHGDQISKALEKYKMTIQEQRTYLVAKIRIPCRIGATEMRQRIEKYAKEVSGDEFYVDNRLIICPRYASKEKVRYIKNVSKETARPWDACPPTREIARFERSQGSVLRFYVIDGHRFSSS
jgi:hypothetical protein